MQQAYNIDSDSDSDDGVDAIAAIAGSSTWHLHDIEKVCLKLTFYPKSRLAWQGYLYVIIFVETLSSVEGADFRIAGFKLERCTEQTPHKQNVGVGTADDHCKGLRRREDFLKSLLNFWVKTNRPFNITPLLFKTDGWLLAARRGLWGAAGLYHIKCSRFRAPRTFRYSHRSTEEILQVRSRI